MSESASIAPGRAPVNAARGTEKPKRRKFTLLLDESLWHGVEEAMESLKQQTKVGVTMQNYIRSAVEIRNAAVIGEKAA